MVADDELKLHFYHCPRFADRMITVGNNTISIENEEQEEADDDSTTDSKTDECLTFRRTIIGPSFGLPMNSMTRILSKHSICSDLFAFSTYDQIIGIMKSPLAQNGTFDTQSMINSYCGYFAHPGHVIGLQVVGDGNYVVSCGGCDKSMLRWRVCEKNEGEQKQNGSKKTTTDYISMLEGGQSGALHKDIENYFYYVQICSQGEISSVKREMSGYISVEQCANIFRALGYFITESGVQRLTKEIKHRFSNENRDGNENNNSIFGVDSKTELASKKETAINLEQFIELYVNYRSIFEIGADEIHMAFERISVASHHVHHEKSENMPIDRQFFFDVLQKKGEKLNREELLHCLESLTGYQRQQLQKMLPKTIDTHFLATNILGFSPMNS